MKKGRKIFWGLMFIVGALALIVGKMGYLEGIGFWSILVSIALVGILIDGILHRNYGAALFSLAFIVIVNDKFLGLEAITPWTVLGAAFLGTIGLSILFPNKEGKRRMEAKCKLEGDFFDNKDEEILCGEEITFSNTFGESVKYLRGQEISKVFLHNTFGELNVYFDNAVLKNGKAYVFVEGVFGEVVLFIPSDWNVNVNVDAIFGDARESGHCNPAGENVLQIEGKAVFGELKICYM